MMHRWFFLQWSKKAVCPGYILDLLVVFVFYFRQYDYFGLFFPWTFGFGVLDDCIATITENLW